MSLVPRHPFLRTQTLNRVFDSTAASYKFFWFLSLLELARTGTVYVPGFYAVQYLPDGRIQRVAPSRPDVPWRVRKHTLMDLDEWAYPRNPLVPLAETVQRLSSR